VNGGANTMGPLRAFRDRFYAGLDRPADALFELCDAILTASRVRSPPHLSLVSVHRRGWGSLYAALSKGGIDSEALRDLLASYDLGAIGTPAEAPIPCGRSPGRPRAEEEEIFRDLWEDETQREVVIESLKAESVRSGREDLRAFEMRLGQRICAKEQGKFSSGLLRIVLLTRLVNKEIACRFIPDSSQHAMVELRAAQERRVSAGKR
jgi:hypothetical protein